MLKVVSIVLSLVALLLFTFLYLRPQHRKIAASLSINPSNLNNGYRMIAMHQNLCYLHNYDDFSIGFFNITIKLIYRFLIFTAFVIAASFFSGFTLPSVFVIGMTTLDFVLFSMWSKDFKEIIANDEADSPFLLVDTTAKKAFRVPLIYTLINDILLYVSLLSLNH